jgi:hypothetical protein
MRYIFDDKQIEKESWCWEAHYADGSSLKQFDDDGYFHQFGEIDQSRLAVFKMVGTTTYSLPFKEGMKLIHYYDNYILNDGEARVRVYCFGYEKDGSKVICSILPNGEMVIGE